MTFCEGLYKIDWDKVPEWIQAIGVVLTLIGLLITLRLQRKTLIEQQRITLIEQQNFLKSYLPILELSDIAYEKEEQHRLIKFNITIRNNYLQQLNIKHDFPEDYNVNVPYIISNVILPSGYKMAFSIDFTLPNVIIEVEEYTGNNVVFTFADALSNKYQQVLIYTGGSNLFLQPAYRIQT